MGNARLLTGHRRGWISLIFLVALGTAALGASWFAPYGYQQQDPRAMLLPPGWSHLMGTDLLGRDLFSRMLYGARLSLSIGLSTALISVLIGTVYGAVSGYVGGRTDNVLMRWVEVVYSLPDLLLIILISVLIGRGAIGILLALSLVSWVTVARVIRGEVLKICTQEYIVAARAAGAPHRVILFRHILPNTAGPLLVTVIYRIPAAILAESTLSFIGLGVPPPFSSWGTLANDGWAAMKFYPHLIIFPAAMIFATILAFNSLGESARERLDPGRTGTRRG